MKQMCKYLILMPFVPDNWLLVISYWLLGRGYSFAPIRKRPEVAEYVIRANTRFAPTKDIPVRVGMNLVFNPPFS